MADDTVLNTGSGGDTLRTDDNAGIKTPVSKIELGKDGIFSDFVAVDNPMPTRHSDGTNFVNQTVILGAGSAEVGNVTNSGTFAVQENGAALTALQLIDDTVITFGTTIYTEATSKGNAIAAVRNDTLATLVSLDNELAPLQVNASGALYTDGSNSTQPISASSLPLPSGASTSANQLPDGHNVTVDNASGASAVNIQDGGNVITVDNGGTFAIQEDGASLTALQLIDDVVATLGTTTYTEATTKGNVIGVVRNDTLATLVNLDNEVAPLQVNASGALYVDGSNSTQPVSGTVTANAGTGTFTVDNGGTFAVQEDGAALTALQLIDDVVATLGTTTYTEATTKGNIIGAVRNDTLATLVNTDNEIAPLQVNTSGALYTEVSGSLPAGTNNIGDVDVLTQPARVATTDNIGAALMTNVVHDGTTATTPKFAIIDAAATPNNTLVAAVIGKKIRVLQLMMVAAGTVIARFEDGAGGTALSGQMNLVANMGFTLPFSPVGWFETGVNTLLNLELSAAISVDGMLVYIEVD